MGTSASSCILCDPPSRDIISEQFFCDVGSGDAVINTISSIVSAIKSWKLGWRIYSASIMRKIATNRQRTQRREMNQSALRKCHNPDFHEQNHRNEEVANNFYRGNDIYSSDLQQVVGVECETIRPPLVSIEIKRGP